MVFASSSPSLRLLAMIGHADDRRSAGDPAVPGTPPAQSRSCAELAELLTPSSLDQAADWSAGVWTLCGGPPPDEPRTWTSMFGPLLAGEVGAVTTSDGHYYRLVRHTDGTVTQDSGTPPEGTWTARLNDLGTLQLEIQMLGPGTENLVPTSSESPARRADGVPDELADSSSRRDAAGRDAADRAEHHLCARDLDGTAARARTHLVAASHLGRCGQPGTSA